MLKFGWIALFAVTFIVAGCSTTTHLVSSDGKSTIDDTNPMDTVVSISDGPGCPTSITPYVPPATSATGSPISFGAARVCDPNGGNCRMMEMTGRAIPTSPADDPTRCTTTVVQTKGLGLGPYLAAAGALFGMIGIGLGGF